MLVDCEDNHLRVVLRGSKLNNPCSTDFIVRKGNIDIRDLYSESPSAKYWYTYGVNWRAIFAFIAGFTVPLPGFIGSFGTTTVSIAASRIYSLGWALSFVIGGLTYWIACLIFPVQGDDRQHAFEELSAYYDEHDLDDLDQVEQVNQTGPVKRMSSTEEKFDNKDIV
jgi:hypothetical protein